MVNQIARSQILFCILRSIEAHRQGFLMFTFFPYYACLGKCCPGFSEHLRTVQHEHAEGSGMPVVRRPGELMGVLEVHGLLSLCGRAGVQSPQIHSGW